MNVLSERFFFYQRIYVLCKVRICISTQSSDNILNSKVFCHASHAYFLFSKFFRSGKIWATRISFLSFLRRMCIIFVNQAIKKIIFSLNLNFCNLNLRRHQMDQICNFLHCATFIYKYVSMTFR